VDTTLGILLSTAVGVGLVHTLIGIDHTLPFVVLGRAHRWPLRRVLGLTLICGVAHVAASVVLGLVGVAFGVGLARLDWIEASRGDVAAWILMGFGLLYAAWSFARERRRQRLVHQHADGTVHTHEHTPSVHDHDTTAPRTVTAWSLFVIFVLGPCEPLIPLLMVPAFEMGAGSVVAVVLAFGVTTVATMTVIVALGYAGLRQVRLGPLEHYAHTLAGLAVAVSGGAIRLLGI
jgi:nickel/cobalt exporter